MTPDLPIPDLDHLGLGDLTDRVRSLDADGVRALLDAEEAGGRRAPVLEVLRARLDQLDAGARPSGGDPSRAPVDLAGAGVGPAGRGTHGRAAGQPPVHGDPTNPAQPR